MVDTDGSNGSIRVLFPSFSSLELFRQSRITETVLVKIDDMQSQAVFHFTFAQIAQIRLPVPVLRSSVATIHHPLGHIDSRTGDIESVINVPDLIDWPAVNSHPQTKIGIFFKLLTDFQRATHRFFRTAKE